MDGCSVKIVFTYTILYFRHIKLSLILYNFQRFSCLQYAIITFSLPCFREFSWCLQTYYPKPLEWERPVDFIHRRRPCQQETLNTRMYQSLTSETCTLDDHQASRFWFGDGSTFSAFSREYTKTHFRYPLPLHEKFLLDIQSYHHFTLQTEEKNKSAYGIFIGLFEVKLKQHLLS